MWIDASRRVSEYSPDTVEIWYSPAICNNEVQCSSIVCRAWIHRALPVSHPWKCFYDSENRQTSAVSPCLPPLYPIMNIDYAVHSVVQTTDQYRPQCTTQCSADHTALHSAVPTSLQILREGGAEHSCQGIICYEQCSLLLCL